MTECVNVTVEARVIRTWRSRLYSALGTFYFHSNRRIAIHCRYRCVSAIHIEMRFRGGPWSRLEPLRRQA